MAEIILTFEWDGKTVHKETKGYVGTQCTEATKFLEEALGKASNRRYKAEYYEQPKQTEHAKLRTGNKSDL